MNVGQLIAKLSTCDNNLPIVVEALDDWWNVESAEIDANSDGDPVVVIEIGAA